MASEFSFDPARPLDYCQHEQHTAYAALLDYYRMGSGRSLRNLLSKYRTQSASGAESTAPPTCRFATIFRWSTKFRWQDRIQAQTEIDLETEQKAKEDAMRQEAAKWAQRRLAVRERDWEQSEKLRELVDQILGESPRFLKTTRKLVRGRDGEPDKEIITVGIDARLMVQALETSSKLQRLAAELETEHTLDEHTEAEDIDKVREKRWKAVQQALEDALTDQSEAIEDDDNSEQEGADV